MYETDLTYTFPSEDGREPDIDRTSIELQDEHDADTQARADAAADADYDVDAWYDAYEPYEPGPYTGDDDTDLAFLADGPDLEF